MAAGSGLFYLHDTVAGDRPLNSPEHRNLFAQIAKRSRYFIVNPGLIDRPEIRGDQIEIGNRYFEGAASGTIMVGERPWTKAFEQLFDWPDAVVDLPYDSPGIDKIIHQLNHDPERQHLIRRNNVVNALTRHDWVYRWEAILQHLGREPLPQLYDRKRRLKKIADAVSAAGAPVTAAS
jgi:hypothetical protein